ncbi:hypothetical protein [Natronorubrum sp. DTA7]|uniref:hypothetical protein n=1 Tax=Natronorubrum sp. DTA7 TaxID=3447016 RepID=UPI003F8622DE
MTTKSETSTTDDQTHSRRRILRASGATVATVSTAGLATTASADENDPESEATKGILADGLEVEGGDTRAFFSGLLSSFSIGRSTEVDKLADEIRNEFRANTEAWISYGNWVIDTYDNVEPAGSVTVQVDVVQSPWYSDKEERVATTIEATFDDENYEYTGLEWHLGKPDNPDYTVEVRNSAAEDANDDLLEYRRKHIDEHGDDHQLPDEEYVSKMAGKYSPRLVFGDDSESVLNVLIGDITGE